MYLYDLGSALRCTMSQVMSIDGQHFVIVPQFSVFGCQTTRQQVQDENSALIWLAYELDAERLGALTLNQRHLQDGARVVIGGSVAVGIVR